MESTATARRTGGHSYDHELRQLELVARLHSAVRLHGDVRAKTGSRERRLIRRRGKRTHRHPQSLVQSGELLADCHHCHGNVMASPEQLILGSHHPQCAVGGDGGKTTTRRDIWPILLRRYLFRPQRLNTAVNVMRLTLAHAVCGSLGSPRFPRRSPASRAALRVSKV